MPSPERPGEIADAKALRAYVLEHIDWPCEVQTLFRDTHLGCRVAVSGALDWFFEHEPEGIILEDDLRARCDFFPLRR